MTPEYHKKLAKRPSTANSPAIPDTRKLHQIDNTNARELYYRIFACCCFGCIHGSEACSNNICPDEWSAYDLRKKQSVEPNLQFWFGEGICNIPDIRNEAEIELPHMQHVTWPARLRALGQQRSFVQLQRYISANPIPPLAQLQMTLSTSLTQVYWIWLHYTTYQMILKLALLLFR